MTRGLTPILVCLLAAPAAAQVVTSLPSELDGVDVQQNLGKHVNLALPFTRHTGEAVTLRKYFGDGKPVILTLNYYRCKTLCSLELNALTNGLRALDFTAGNEFRVVTVSIDHREGPELARGKRTRYLESLGKGDVDWDFLVGSEASVRALAAQVGFGFKYLKEQDEFAHRAVIFVLSPEGKITRYLEGLGGEGTGQGSAIPARDLKFAIMDASDGKVGSFLEQFIQSCFHYDPSLGRYGPFAMGIMRLGGLITLVVLTVFLAIFWRRERRMKRVAQAA